MKERESSLKLRYDNGIVLTLPVELLHISLIRYPFLNTVIAFILKIPDLSSILFYSRIEFWMQNVV